MMNNGIKSMTNYANNYPPHINVIQQMVTQVITFPYQHATCFFFSIYFSQALCASSLFFSQYAFDIHQHFVLSLSLFFLGRNSFSLQAFGLLFLLCSMLFQIIQQYKNNGNASICYWMHVSKLVKVEEKKVMAQRGETKDIFVWLSVWVIGFRNECPNHIQT